MRQPGFGGSTGGGVSEPETLPNMKSSGVMLSGAEGMSGRAGSDEAVAGTEQGRISHGMGSPRGGYYHCMGEGCSYKTRAAHGLRAHVSSHKRHAMGSTAGEGSSSSAGSTGGVASSMSAGSSPSHGMSDKVLRAQASPANHLSSCYERGDNGGGSYGYHISRM